MLCSFWAHNVCLCTLLYLRQCECALAVRHAGSTTRPPAHKPRMHIPGAAGVNKGAPPEHLRRHSTRGTAANMFDRSSGRLRGYGATAARVTPDHKVGSSNLSGLIDCVSAAHGSLTTRPLTAHIERSEARAPAYGAQGARLALHGLSMVIDFGPSPQGAMAQRQRA